MLRVFGSRFQNCDGISRRNFLEIGSSVLGLSMADIFRMRAAAAAENPSLSPKSSKSVIVFWTHGGLSQQDTYDMKPDSPAEFRGPYQPVKTNVPGIEITERFPCQTRVMDKLSIVRSVYHESALHAASAHWMQTGYSGPTLARNAPQKPSFGSVIARAKGPNQPNLPAYVTIPKSEAFGYQGSVYLGVGSNPFELNADPNSPKFEVPNLTLPTDLSLQDVRHRADLLRRFDTLRRDVDATGTLAGLDSFKVQALEMVTGDRVREAFDLNKESPELRDRYGRHLYGQSALLARRLVEAGSTCVTINTGYWDHHAEIHKGMEEHLPPLDAAIAALVEDLDARGMLENVVVYCAGEFGRTPMINGIAGRDHWPGSFSVIFGGGGLQGGRIVGASEPRGGKVRENPVTPLDVLATLYHALDIPLETHFDDATGRPVSIVGSGRPIKELL